MEAPSAASGVSPAELLMGCRLRNALDGLHLDNVELPPVCQASPAGAFEVGAAVYARCYISDDKWVPEQVTARIGAVSYVLCTTDGRILRRHVDQVIPLHVVESESGPAQHKDVTLEVPLHVPADQTANPPDQQDHADDPPIVLRRSTKVRTAPQRFDDFRQHSLGREELL